MIEDYVHYVCSSAVPKAMKFELVQSESKRESEIQALKQETGAMKASSETWKMNYLHLKVLAWRTRTSYCHNLFVNTQLT